MHGLSEKGSALRVFKEMTMKKKLENRAKAAHPVGSMNTEIAFHKSGTREAARYVSDSTVHEEALENGRWIGLYWSASGQVQRENIAAGLPGLGTLEFPLHAFELEIDGQDLRNH
jgi:hypothetical protein